MCVCVRVRVRVCVCVCVFASVFFGGATKVLAPSIVRVLQRIAVLQHVVVCALGVRDNVECLLDCLAPHSATQCNTLQGTATHCNTLQHSDKAGCRHHCFIAHTATHCNTLQRTATHCYTLQHADKAGCLHMYTFGFYPTLL